MPEAKKKTTAKAPKEKAPAKEKPVKAVKKAAPKAPEATDVIETTTVAMEHDQEVAAKVAKGGSFIPAIGRRKTAIARVRLIKNGKGAVAVNGKTFDGYFKTFDLRTQIMAPLKAVGQDTSVDISARVIGGGIRGQAEAVRHGIARALIILNPTFRKTLKKLGYLSRDPRERERKKFGKKSARRSPQWSKR
ncbi:MAG: 30S ribosomal protein S9 [Patescibacteria group bacterium]|jgi:small subunit ribosomal protein S9